MGRRKKRAQDLSRLSPWLISTQEARCDHMRLRRQNAQASRHLQAARRDRRAIQHQHQALRLHRLPVDHQRLSLLPSRLYSRHQRGYRRDYHHRQFFKFSRPPRATEASTTSSRAKASSFACSISPVLLYYSITCIIAGIFICPVAALSDTNDTKHSLNVLGLFANANTVILSLLGIAVFAVMWKLVGVVQNTLFALAQEAGDSATRNGHKRGKNVRAKSDAFASQLQRADQAVDEAKAFLTTAVTRPPTPATLPVGTRQDQQDAEVAYLMSKLPGVSPQSNDHTSIVFDKYGTPVSIPVDNSPLAVFRGIALPEEHAKAVNKPVELVEDAVSIKGDRVRMGEIGYISGFLPSPKNEKDGKKYIQVTIPSHDPQTMWLPVDSLKGNPNRKWGDIGIEATIQTRRPRAEKDMTFEEDDYPITELVSQLYTAFAKAGQVNTMLSDDIFRVLNNRDRIKAFARKLGKAVESAGISEAFDKTAKWSINDFEDRGVWVNQQTQGTGIYMWIYSDFKSFTAYDGQEPRNYIGKTQVRFGKRWKQHVDSTQEAEQGNAPAVHYKIAAAAKRRWCVMLARTDDTWTSEEYLLAEQALILLLRAYRPEALAMKPAVLHNNGQIQPEQKESMRSLINGLDAQAVASVLSCLADTVFDDIGWTNTLKHSGGCNWDSPLARWDEFDEVLFVKVDSGDRWTYFRRPRQVTKVGSSGRQLAQLCYGVVKSSRGKNMSPTLAFNESLAQAGPGIGDTVYMSVEIMKQGRHDHAFGRLPDIAGRKSWDEANQVGVRFEWKNSKGQWLAKYWQSSAMMDLKDDAYPASQTTWAHAIALRHKLERKSFVQAPSWWQVMNPTRILQVEFDNFEQKFIIKEPDLARTTVAFPGVESDNTIRQRMQLLGLGGYGNTTPTISQANQLNLSEAKGQGRRRQYCDTAECDIVRRLSEGIVSNRETAGSGGKYTQLSPGQCRICKAFGRRCTFTLNSRLFNSANSTQIMRALTFYPPISMPFKINDPHYNTAKAE
ncbi:hypothetical protein M409DRAFT_24336 [Zasmidium cellare ATCC 36951]|uniref:Uncharacterized protein n=1 Tax=Zasmidium cellare ATCC 36951 TaxID=1080233 RepID=A0A6A6CEE8_ZASCE|nr:uncharacterized protein M409DRAFT_24336 [Zasmidium cellare ATCC 36951]KAF2165485.1 hypothetical protein M409DRAFT_24336 [Zasmidium cellare ATCC 36951]